ncbi:hypothetical protein Cantr_00995 [Candida viswanathii]|uniref:Uncharacterized protein n=1 Tax=Candida viswanathii TaxID=5486 RepID=A0A367YGT9_9ASCO|nr:hypothetical protein Cantr_00995 [Candida viswanathii]
MSIEERVEELQLLFNENASLIECSSARLDRLQEEVLREDTSFDEIRLMLQDLLTKLRSLSKFEGPYGPYLQEISNAANAVDDANDDFHVQLNSVFKALQ